jgi:hypothetical protein
MYFNEATLYCDNMPTSPVQDLTVRQMLLYMVTSHIAALNAALNGAPASPIVGRISDATEGSVSVKSQMDYPAGSPQWWQQSKYGSAFWAATTQFRTMFYISAPTRTFQPYGGGLAGLFS